MHYKHSGKALYIQLEGEIDHHTTKGLKEKIARAFEPTDCRQMIFDLSRVTFMDSSGIGMIIGRYKNAQERGGTVAITGMNPGIERIFQISGLAKIINSYASVEDAEKALGESVQ
ncbi:MAG: anti-sigma F factor antagonist [Defluviitaleaceae bacterium]|nr:anti-sigma F factor antagonist [Defluviitaleaceae bacterium]